MLNNRYQHNIDAKGRVFVPAKMREKLGDCFVAAAVLDRCVSLYPQDEWDRLIESISALPMNKTDKLLRYLSNNAADVQVDAQGRISLPKHLLEYASLGKEALIVGNGKKAEIWDPQCYAEEMSAITPETVKEMFAELNL